MDIGKQQRVIIVEVDEALAHPAPIEEPAEVSTMTDQGDAWPLPLDLDSEPDPAWADLKA
jgi:hypothetical protein